MAARTNAVRILEGLGVPHELREYEVDPNDLSADLGHLGNWQHPDVWKAMEDAAKRIRKCGKAPGILVGEADGQRCLDAGFLFVAVGADTGMLVRGSDSLAAKFKKA